MSVHSSPAPAWTLLRHMLTHLVVPVLLATAMALTYLGAFHQPEPHGVRVDVVGPGPEVAVLAQTVQDRLGDGVAVRTVPTVDDARQALTGPRDRRRLHARPRAPDTDAGRRR